MKKIIIDTYHSPDKTSIKTKDHKYSVMTGFGEKTFYFDTKREVEDFIRKFSQDLTDLFFLYNESFARAFVAYRTLWFYMDDIENGDIAINHDCDGLVVSLTRQFDRIVHWKHGYDAYRLTNDISMIGQALKEFWKLLVHVTAKRNQWADNYRFRLEVDMVDNFMQRLEIMTTPMKDNIVVTYREMERLIENLDIPVNLNSDYQRKDFKEKVIKLRKTETSEENQYTRAL